MYVCDLEGCVCNPKYSKDCTHPRGILNDVDTNKKSLDYSIYLCVDISRGESAHVDEKQ